MSNQRGTPFVSGSFVNFVAAVVKALPRNLSEENMLFWSGHGEILSQTLWDTLSLVNSGKTGPKDVAAALERKIAMMEGLAREIQSQTNAQPTPHQDIQIRFQLGDRSYEAVGGFQKENEPPIDLCIAFDRVNDDGLVVDNHDDIQYMHERLAEFPVELEDYHLATNLRTDEVSNQVYCFEKTRTGWHGTTGNIFGNVRPNTLILRLIAPS